MKTLLALISILITGNALLNSRSLTATRSIEARTRTHESSSKEKTGRVAFIGGSITQMEGYRPILADWLQKRFLKQSSNSSTQVYPPPAPPQVLFVCVNMFYPRGELTFFSWSSQSTTTKMQVTPTRTVSADSRESYAKLVRFNPTWTLFAPIS